MALIALSATVLAAIFLVPQIVRLLVRGDTKGVSATWAGFGLITNLAWVDYLWQQGTLAPVAAPAIALVTYGITLVVIVRIDQGHRWIGSSIVYAVMIALTASLGGLIAMGLALAVAPVIQVAPELLAVFKERHPSGVSPASWAWRGRRQSCGESTAGSRVTWLSSVMGSSAPRPRPSSSVGGWRPAPVAPWSAPPGEHQGRGRLEVVTSRRAPDCD